MVAKGVRVTGGAETAAAFDKLAADVADMTATHERIARARLGGVARRTPVLSGALANSWDARGSASAGTILSPLPYAGPIEGGWIRRNIAPAAMIARTLEAETDAIVAEYETSIADMARKRGFPRE
jgi:hypothetical protein